VGCKYRNSAHFSVTLVERLETMKTGIWQQILTYFYIRKRDPDDPKNINTSLMHGMNRISLFVFLIAVLIMIVRLFRH
jgi:hypothetical protein